MKSTAFLMATLMVVPKGAAQTKPLSVCEIVARAADWNNNVVLVRANYYGGMEDSFLFDEKCPGKEIWLDYPEHAAQEDALIKDNLRGQRTPVTLDRNAKFAEFRHYADIRSDTNSMCQKMDIQITAVGRIDSKRGNTPKRNCLPFGMCTYPARFVLGSVQQVIANESKYPCRK